MAEFRDFPKIERFKGVRMTITQKMHGTNAQVYIYKEDGEAGSLITEAGSRSRFLTEDDDNYGFCKFVKNNLGSFNDLLGVGRHFGEWCGPGINSGEGLTEKTLFIFDWERFYGKELPPNVRTIPLLYDGQYDEDAIEGVMNDLMVNGSRAAPGFMRPEGIVITINGVRYKKVFKAEETAWEVGEKEKKEKIASIDVSHLLQPIRLEKLLSRDQRYARDYPKTLPDICRDYVADLEIEGQIVAQCDDELKAIKKELGRQVFKFIKEMI